MGIWFFIILTLLLSGVFSGVELAFISVNKLKLELSKNSGKYPSKLLAKFNEDASSFISSLLVGNNIVLVAFTSLIAIVISPVGANGLLPAEWNNEFLVLLLQTAVATVLVLIFGEYFPKTLFRINPEKALNTFVVPINVFFYWWGKYIAKVFTFISTFLIKIILRKSFEEDKQELTSTDLEYFIRETSLSNSDGIVDEDELNSDMFEKALYLKEIKVRECMVPRTEIEAIEVNESIATLKDAFFQSGHSKVMVFDDNLDKVIGYVHHLSLLDKPKKIKDILFEISVVPETLNARDLLTQFTSENKTVAWVVDEYGGTAGIITLEDIIEEIFGEIQDEHDKDEHVEQKISENEYVFAGRLEIDYLNEKYDLKIPEGEYETLAGYVVERNEDIPEVNEELIIDRFKIVIIGASDMRINTLRLEVLIEEL